MIRIKKACAGAIALAIGACASATVAQSADWDGFYVGAHAGYGLFDADGVSGTPFNLEADGPMGGVYLGYNMDMGDYVLGLEADASFGDQSDTVPVFAFGALRLTNHGQHTFRARAGMKTGSSGLLYLTGGLALGDFWATISNGQRDKDFLIGGVVGGGYEAKVTDNLSARAEYLYANFGDNTFNAGGAFNLDVDTHTFRAGIGWNF